MSTQAPSLIAKRYQLLHKIGQGGMGVIYKAQDRLTGQAVALKEVLIDPVNLQFTSRGNTMTNTDIALAREFKTLSSLRHPNIISVLDYGYTDKRHPFYTMEYLDSTHNLLVAGRNRSIRKWLLWRKQIT